MEKILPKKNYPWHIIWEFYFFHKLEKSVKMHKFCNLSDFSANWIFFPKLMLTKILRGLWEWVYINFFRQIKQSRFEGRTMSLQLVIFLTPQPHFLPCFCRCHATMTTNRASLPPFWHTSLMGKGHGPVHVARHHLLKQQPDLCPNSHGPVTSPSLYPAPFLLLSLSSGS